MKSHFAVAVWSLAGIAVALACAGLPRYVRGDIRARGIVAIPPGAPVSLLPALVRGPIDEPITAGIVQALEQRGHPIVQPADATVLVGYRFVSDQTRGGGQSDGLEALWAITAPFDCAERFGQRLAIVATRGSDGQPGELLWLGELCSDGGGRPPTRYARAFARELIQGFGMNRTPRRFEFLSQAQGETLLLEQGLHAIPEPAARTPAARQPVPLDPPNHPEPAVPQRPTRRAAAIELASPGEGLVEPGPTWSEATDACSLLSQRPEVGCALMVIVESGAPVLELGYPTRAAALANWKRDVAGTGSVFCEVAMRHGVFELAGIRISTPKQRALRSCGARVGNLDAP